MRRLFKSFLLGAGGLVFALALTTSAAQAQFVCRDDITGTGGGATAAGGVASVACGTLADASGVGATNTAIGNNANASGTNSGNTATGHDVNASGNTSANIATGFLVNASGNTSANIATGLLANARGNNSQNIAVGSSANASGDGARNTAIGYQAVAHLNSSAFGAGANATFANSTAIGSGATTTRANQQMFGTGANTYTMPGITSVASQAAQGAPIAIVTTNAGGDLAAHTIAQLGLATTGDIAGVNSQISNLNSQIGILNNRVNDAFKKIDQNTQGIAIAMAMGGLVMPTGKNFAIGVNLGFFDDKQAFAAQSALRLNDTFSLNGAVGVGFDGNQVGGRVGLTAAW